MCKQHFERRRGLPRTAGVPRHRGPDSIDRVVERNQVVNQQRPQQAGGDAGRDADPGMGDALEPRFVTVGVDALDAEDDRADGQWREDEGESAEVVRG